MEMKDYVEKVKKWRYLNLHRNKWPLILTSSFLNSLLILLWLYYQWQCCQCKHYFFNGSSVFSLDLNIFIKFLPEQLCCSDISITYFLLVSIRTYNLFKHFIWRCSLFVKHGRRSILKVSNFTDTIHTGVTHRFFGGICNQRAPFFFFFFFNEKTGCYT